METTEAIIPAAHRRIRTSALVSALLILTSHSIAYGQNVKIETDKKVDQPTATCSRPSSYFLKSGNDTLYAYTGNNPVFPGGKKGLESFKSKHLKYPAICRKSGITGTVQVNYIIEKDGTLSNIRVTEGVSPSLDDEALRVTRLIPRWVPGTENGRPVRFISGTSYRFGPPPCAAEETDEGEPAISFGQKPPSTPDEDTPFVVVEQMPVFPGGDKELLSYIATNTKYPENARKNNIQGRVILRFCVTRKGQVDRISVLKGVNEDLDNEAVRVVSTLPVFTPGYQGGKAVDVWYMVPVTFRLSDKEEAGYTNPEFAITGYDRAPAYKGGEKAILKSIRSNLSYPETARSRGAEGKVIINYCIGSSGLVENATVFRSKDADLDAEALRVIKLLPRCKPASLNGKPVHIWYQMPVIFRLN